MDFFGRADGSLILLLGIGLFFILKRIFDLNAHAVLGMLLFYVSLSLISIRWLLAVGLFYIVCFIIDRAMRIPRYIRYRNRRFWEKWTITS